MRIPRPERKFSYTRSRKKDRNEYLLEGSFQIALPDEIRFIGEYPRRVHLGDSLGIHGKQKILSPANGIAEIISLDFGEKAFRVTQDGSLEPKKEFQNQNYDLNSFLNRLEKSAVYSLDFEDLPLAEYLGEFAKRPDAELVISPFTRFEGPNFRSILQKDYPEELELLSGLLMKVFPKQKIKNFLPDTKIQYKYPMGIPDYFSHKLGGYDILSPEKKDAGRVYYLGAETIWHLIRSVYFDIPFTKRHLTVKYVNKSGQIERRERIFLLSNGQSFQFLEKLFSFPYETYSLDELFQPSRIFSKNEEYFFNIFQDHSLVFFEKKPVKARESICTECMECNQYCPTSANPVSLVRSGLGSFSSHSCIQCGLCTIYCPSGIDLRSRIRDRLKVDWNA